jgi:hypothetical protein
MGTQAALRGSSWGTGTGYGSGGSGGSGGGDGGQSFSALTALGKRAKRDRRSVEQIQKHFKSRKIDQQGDPHDDNSCSHAHAHAHAHTHAHARSQSTHLEGVESQSQPAEFEACAESWLAQVMEEADGPADEDCGGDGKAA